MFPKFRRRSTRLKDYDYAQEGAYFVTICAQGRAHIFGEVVNGEMLVSPIGEVVQTCWDAIPVHFPHVELDAFVVMPNHLHGILVIAEYPTRDVGAQYIAPLQTAPQSMLHPQTTAAKGGVTPNNVARGSLGSIIRSFKAAVTRLVASQVETSIWQRNYHDHIIRNIAQLDHIRAYIAANPARWHLDSLYDASG
jgi:REP element-mobilizing transposase RayT